MYVNEITEKEDEVLVILLNIKYHIDKEKWTEELRKEFDSCTAYFEQQPHQHVETSPVNHKEPVYQLEAKLKELSKPQTSQAYVVNRRKYRLRGKRL